MHDAAHKVADLETMVVRPGPPRAAEGAKQFLRGEGDGDVVAHGGRAVLALGALGVVFGDIGTSPLYAEQVVFTAHRAAAQVTAAGVYGVISLIFWSLIVVVTIKYAGVIMRAHNRGDGGIMALTALVTRSRLTRRALLVTLGIFGAALFFGDGVITPAISVLSAMEGLKVAAPGLGQLVVPISVGVLVALFAVQSRGTGTVGWLFGPVMLVWFAVVAVLGAHEVVRHPGVLRALSPAWGARFLLDHDIAGFLALGGVVLAITGAEALYADRGHFGAAPIRIAWLAVVFPAVVLSYLGQGALILAHPRAVANPFFLLVPGWAQFPLVALATAATIIASQAVITGSFSVARQAVQLGFLPRLKVLHPSKLEGQIYVPIVNVALCIGVVALVLAFRGSARLADAYGVAVTGTFVLNTILFLAVARSRWRTATWKLAGAGAVLLSVELTFFAANVEKFLHGAWLPLAVGVVMSAVMTTWRKGQVIVTRNRTEQEGPLAEFLDGFADRDPPVHRAPGTGIFLNPTKSTTPLALRALVESIHALPKKLLIVSVEAVTVPYVADEDRFILDHVGRRTSKVSHLTIAFGYREQFNVPEALRLARKLGLLERNLDLEDASYFVSRILIAPSATPGMARWRRNLFLAMARNAASPIGHFHLPSTRTVLMGLQIALAEPQRTRSTRPLRDPIGLLLEGSRRRR